jgi:hypothetical protein
MKLHRYGLGVPMQKNCPGSADSGHGAIVDLRCGVTHGVQYVSLTTQSYVAGRS